MPKWPYDLEHCPRCDSVATVDITLVRADITYCSSCAFAANSVRWREIHENGALRAVLVKRPTSFRDDMKLANRQTAVSVRHHLADSNNAISDIRELLGGADVR